MNLFLKESQQPHLSFSKSKRELTLLFFFDGSSFTVTGEGGQMWAINAMVMDMDVSLRCHYENVVQLFLIGSFNFQHEKLKLILL